MQPVTQIELRAVLPAGFTLPPRASVYELRLDGAEVMALDDLAGTMGAVHLACRLRGLVEPPDGAWTRLTLAHARGRMVHVGRVRWRPAEVGRFITRSLERLQNARACHGWIEAGAPPPASLVAAWEGSRHAA